MISNPPTFIGRYDNEWGYSQRVVDLAHEVADKWPKGDVALTDPLDEFCRTSPDADECRVYDE